MSEDNINIPSGKVKVTGLPLTPELRLLAAMAFRLTLVHYPAQGMFITDRELENVCGISALPVEGGVFIQVWSSREMLKVEGGE